MKDSKGLIMSVVHKMFEIAGEDPSGVDFKEDGWYDRYTWTEEQQEAFRTWFIQRLREDRKLREAVMAFPGSVRRKNLERVVDLFLLSYGLRVERAK